MPGPFARLGRRALLHNRARIDRFKLASRAHVRARLLADATIGDAVRAHAAEHGIAERDVWATVDTYVREIVPFFNVVAYYQIGYRVSGWLLNLFYKVSVEFAEPKARERLPRDAVIVYVMNHRSNADYVLVSYALAGQVAISYAVGEWARAFPLEHVFKAFGSYFIRRRYREPLYHAVLERYVQLITREGVTQGIFVEGGLTRDGKLRPPKIGLLDYVLGIGARSGVRGAPARRPGRRELRPRAGGPVAATRARLEGRGAPPSRLSQAWEVGRYVAWNLARLLTRQWKRYGRAAVVVGAPIPLGPWFAAQQDLFAHRRSRSAWRASNRCATTCWRASER